METSFYTGFVTSFVDRVLCLSTAEWFITKLPSNKKLLAKKISLWPPREEKKQTKTKSALVTNTYIAIQESVSCIEILFCFVS
jgi:hypothetical protein